MSNNEPISTNLKLNMSEFSLVTVFDPVHCWYAQRIFEFLFRMSPLSYKYDYPKRRNTTLKYDSIFMDTVYNACTVAQHYVTFSHCRVILSLLVPIYHSKYFIL